MDDLHVVMGCFVISWSGLWLEKIKENDQTYIKNLEERLPFINEKDPGTSDINTESSNRCYNGKWPVAPFTNMV